MTPAQKQLRKVVRSYARLLTLASLEDPEIARKALRDFSNCVDACDATDPDDHDALRLCCLNVPESLREDCEKLAARAHELCRSVPLEERAARATGFRASQKAALAVAAVLVASALWFKGADAASGALRAAGFHGEAAKKLRSKLERLMLSATSLPELAELVWDKLSYQNVTWASQLAYLYSFLGSMLPGPLMLLVNAAAVGVLGLKGLRSVS